MIVRGLLVSSACFLFSACAPIYTRMPSAFDVSEITAIPKANGAVIKIVAARRIDDVTAWLGDDNWLYITIPDTSINMERLAQLEKSSLVERTEFFRYAEAVQVTLQLRTKMAHLEILQYPDEFNIYVILYHSKSNL